MNRSGYTVRAGMGRELQILADSKAQLRGQGPQHGLVGRFRPARIGNDTGLHRCHRKIDSPNL